MTFFHVQPYQSSFQRLLMCLTSFFFLMIRRPPRSTLFPYTTPSDLRPNRLTGVQHRLRQHGRRVIDLTRSNRSEEHTSELLSPDHLVCRLLLEKKNNVGTCSCTLRLKWMGGLFLRSGFFPSNRLLRFSVSFSAFSPPTFIRL